MNRTATSSSRRHTLAIVLMQGAAGSDAAGAPLHRSDVAAIGAYAGTYGAAPAKTDGPPWG